MPAKPTAVTHPLLTTLARYRFSFLLVVVVVMLAAQPVFEARQAVVTRVVLIVMFLAGVHAIADRQLPLRLGVFLMAAASLAGVLQPFIDSTPLAVARHLLVIGFLALMIVTLMRHILTDRSVTPDTISGAVCVYLLLGYTFAVVFALIETMYPGSVRLEGVLPSADVAEATLGGERFSVMIYFSFVTMTTLGYGDITPLTGLTRTLAFLEAMFGQLFLAVLIAGLVGIRIALATRPPDKPS